MSSGLGGMVRRLSAAQHRLFSAAHVDLLSTTTPANGDVPTYVAASGKWTPQAPAVGGGDFVLSSDQTLGSAVNDITFSSIPGTAKDLFITFDMLYSSTGGHPLHLRLNGISTSTYDQQSSDCVVTTVETAAINNAAQIVIGNLTVSTDPAGSSIAGWVFIPDYANTDFFKRVQYESTEYYGGLMVHNWGVGALQGSAGTAISSVTLKSSSGNLKIGSRARLYLLG